MTCCSESSCATWSRMFALRSSSAPRFRALDIDLGNSRHQIGGQDLFRDPQMLINDRLDASGARPPYERSHLRSEHPNFFRPESRGARPGMGLGESGPRPDRRPSLCRPSGRAPRFTSQRYDTESRPIDLAVHGVFEQDGSDDVIAEAGTLNDATAHGVHQSDISSSSLNTDPRRCRRGLRALGVLPPL